VQVAEYATCTPFSQLPVAESATVSVTNVTGEAGMARAKINKKSQKNLCPFFMGTSLRFTHFSIFAECRLMDFNKKI
jgi:hypothetical protein